MKRQFQILLSFCVMIIIGSSNYTAAYQLTQSEIENKEAANIFLQIEEGLSTGNVELFSNYFGDKTYLSLGNGYSGYFSSSQAYYVIKDFLGLYKPLNFKFTSKVIDRNSPFASGVLRYSLRGVRSSAMVFISLKKVNERWIITQITIN